MDSYDWLEIALTVHTDLSGRLHPRLRLLERPGGAQAQDVT